MHDKFKKRHRVPKASDRVRRQIALEAARRLYPKVGPEEGTTTLRDAAEAEYYTAKRKAAAVLGLTVRPGDLPSDSEVREQVLSLARSKDPFVEHDESPEGEVEQIADHLDRFTIFKMRLQPLESVKQDPKWHPEGDALYHSLQVFERAREARPFDEEFLLAALLHDVGKAIDPANHVAAGLTALRGTITERTAWLIEHHMDLLARPARPVSPRVRRALEGSEFFDDLVLLRDADEAGRVPGAEVGTIDEALDYLRGLEAEDHFGL